jgi:hypothetical protein
LQAVEGSIDTAHFSFAHLTFDKGEDEVLDVQKHLSSPMSRMSFNHVRWIADDPRAPSSKWSRMRLASLSPEAAWRKMATFIGASPSS